MEAVTTRQISDACLAVAKQSRLDLTIIEPAVLPIIKLAIDSKCAGAEAISLFLSLDSASGNVTVFKDKIPQFSQNLDGGLKKLLNNKDGFTDLSEQIKPVLEFARSLAVIASKGIVMRIAAGCSNENLQKITEGIKQILPDVAIEPVDTAGIKEQFEIECADGKELPIFALASALAAFGVYEFKGRLNLISQSSIAKQKMRSQLSLTAQACLAIFLFSIALIHPIEIKIEQVEAASVGIETKAIGTRPVKWKIEQLGKQIEFLKQKQAAYSIADKQLICVPWPQVMRIIADSVPNEIRLLDIFAPPDSAEFVIIGQADEESIVYDFTRLLQSSPFIGAAQVDDIEYDNSQAETIVNYKIACTVQLPESDS